MPLVGDRPLLATAPLASPGVAELVEASALPEFGIVFCVIGMLLLLPMAFWWPQHSQPARVMPAATTPAQAKRFFRPMIVPLPQKGCTPAQPRAVRAPGRRRGPIGLINFHPQKRSGYSEEVETDQEQNTRNLKGP